MLRTKLYNPSDAEKLILKEGKHGEYRKHIESNAMDSDGRTYLHQVVLQGDSAQLVEEAIKAGCDINKADQFGLNATHLACKKGYKNTVEKLISFGADLTAFSGCGASPLMLAARQNAVEVVKLLLSTPGVDVNLHNVRHETALHFAVGAGSLESTSLLLKSGAKVNYSDKEGLTPLLVAVRLKDFKLVQLLVDAHANVNYVDPIGRTPLHWAADLGAVDIVQLLINRHVNIDVTDINGHTPFVCAIKSNQPQVVKLLLDEGCDQHSVDGLMGTPLALASLKGFMECVEVLLDAGADCDDISFFGMTPLQLAAFESKVDVVKLLLQRGANPNADSRSCGTALFKALLHVSTENEKQRHEILAVLLRAGADVNYRLTNVSIFKPLQYGRTCPLYFAISAGYLSLVRMLLLAGARVSRSEMAAWMAQYHGMYMFDMSSLLAHIKEWTEEPMSLKNTCRIAVRAAMGNRVALGFSELPLANSLKRFINFEELDYMPVERVQMSSEYTSEMVNIMPQMKPCSLRALEGSLLHTALTKPSAALPSLPYTRVGCTSHEMTDI